MGMAQLYSWPNLTELATATMSPWTKFLVILILSATTTRATLWDRNVSVEDGKFNIFWSVDKDSITFEIQVETTGYVALGLSDNGGMIGADIVTGWVKGSDAKMQDRFSTEYVQPTIDPSQDYRLLAASDNGSHTVLRFRRKLKTCDDRDFLIKNESMFLMYAWHDTDPVSEDALDYHSTNRGSVSVNLLHDQKFTLNLTPDVFHRDFILQNFSVPAVYTHYACTLFKIPKTGRPVSYIGHDAILSHTDVKLTHHVAMYGCFIDEYSYLEEIFNTAPSANCTDPTESKLKGACRNLLTVWGIGSAGEALPDNGGNVFGDVNHDTFILQEIHYHNPEMHSGYVANTGLRFYLTERPLAYRGANIYLSINILNTFFVPPNQNSFLTVVHFPKECTQKLLPPDGIFLTMSYLHAHQLGRKVKLRHFRGNVELPTISKTDYLDYERNVKNVFPTPVNILPGDHITLECTYNSSSRTVVTTGGQRVSEEMCSTFISYYPEISIKYVEIRPYESSFQHLFGAQRMTDGQIHKNESLSYYLANYNWGNATDDFISKIQEMQNGFLPGVCWESQAKLNHFNTSYPNISSPYQESTEYC